MDKMSELIITVICTFIASSGFWTLLMKWIDHKGFKTKLLLGLAHDRIMYLGMRYIERGWITSDEYENLHDYLYVPYEKNGGNGSVKRVMDAVKRLPIKPADYKGGD